MNAKQFFVLVSKMRDAQKMYFKYRSDERLQEALRLEKEIDQEILRVNLALSQKESEELSNQQ